MEPNLVCQRDKAAGGGEKENEKEAGEAPVVSVDVAMQRAVVTKTKRKPTRKKVALDLDEDS